jgi:hypothetical protein
MMTISSSDIQQNDTNQVCVRNSIADVTFYDSSNVVSKIESAHVDKFPFLFTEKTRQIEAETKASLVKHLKPGNDLPLQPLHDDLIIGIILLCAFLLSIARTTSK